MNRGLTFFVSQRQVAESTFNSKEQRFFSAAQARQEQAATCPVARQANHQKEVIILRRSQQNPIVHAASLPCATAVNGLSTDSAEIVTKTAHCQLKRPLQILQAQKSKRLSCWPIDRLCGLHHPPSIAPLSWSKKNHPRSPPPKKKLTVWKYRASWRFCAPRDIRAIALSS